MSQFDPYGQEELELQEREKRALLTLLRQPKQGQVVSGILVGGQGPGDAFADTVEKGRARRDLDAIPQRRAEVVQRYNQGLDEALAAGTPEALARHPATRSQGMALIQKRMEQQMADEEMAKLLGGQGGGQRGALPGAVAAANPQEPPPYNVAVTMSMSSNPTVAARGKTIIENYYKGHDPKNTVRMGPGGEYREIPGAMSALSRTLEAQEQARANWDLTTVPNQFHGQDTVTRGDAVRRLSPGSAAGGPPVPPSAPPPSAASPQANGVAPNGSVRPPPAPADDLAAWGGLEGAVNAFKNFVTKGDMVGASHIGAALAKQGIKVDVQMPLQEGQRREMVASAESPKGMPGPSAVKPQAAPMQPQVQTGQVAWGSTNPIAKEGAMMDAKTFAERRKADLEILKTVPSTMRQLEELRGMADNTPSGVLNYAVKAYDQIMPLVDKNFTGTQAGANARAFEAQTGELIGNILKTYGYNPSNVDLRAAQSRMAQGVDTPTARKEVINLLQRGLQFEVTEAQKRLGMPTANPTEPGAAAAAPTPGQSAPARALPQAAGGYDEKLFGAKPTFGGALTERAKGMFSGEAAEGARDAWGNLGIGLGQTLPDALLPKEARGFTKQDWEDHWKKVKKEQEARSAADPRYESGLRFGEAANPTAAVGGGVTSLPKAIALAGAVGYTRPAESGFDRFQNTVGDAAMQGVGTTVAKILPNTALPKSMQNAEAVREKFKDVPLTGAQVNPSDMFSRVGAWLGVNERAGEAQAREITKKLLSETGSKATTVSSKVLDDRAKEMADAYQKLFPKNVSAKIGTDEANALRTAINNVGKVEDLMAKAPQLAAVYNALKSGNPTTIRVPNLHEAWKEVGQVAGHESSAAAGEIRKVLTKVMEKGLGKDGVDQFRTLNRQWGNLEDLRRILSGNAGLGTGTAADFLRPSRIVEEGGRNPVLGQSAKDAIEFIQKFGVRDAKQPGVHTWNLNNPGTWGNVPGSGMAASAFDFNALNAPGSIKAIIESLRLGTQLGPRELTEPGRQ